jgi:hypothetical protein
LIQIAVKLETLIASMNKLEASMSGKAEQRDLTELREKVNELEKRVELQAEQQATRWGRLAGIATGAGTVGSLVTVALKLIFGH